MTIDTRLCLVPADHQFVPANLQTDRAIDHAAAIAVGIRIEIKGIVQGVGFRPWVYRLAEEERIAGRIWNDAAGVTIEAFGTDEAIMLFLHRLETSVPPAAEIREFRWHAIPAEEVNSFTILASNPDGAPAVSIPPDLATCTDCVREIFDPGNRRYRYPFTNCTNCGPRFTIAHDIPYDRASTTMARFPMCEDCRREYVTATDRRFHAQPNACPACGPRLVAVDLSGAYLSGDAIEAAAEAIATGRVVAVKGVGGFHLACDATSSEAVQRLRTRKRRDEKPFAIMVRDLAAALEIAVVRESERSLLESVQRPIVLLRKRVPSPIAEEVAPRNKLLGVMLPYTPLHHLLLEAAGRPLVMTSGNFSEEPIAYRNDEALTGLNAIADLFLMHDREIVTRCDDSIVRVSAAGPTIIRRSRGWVPRGVHAHRSFAAPVLACGAHLKNTFALGIGELVHLGPHIGDLENVETMQSYEEAIMRMERFLKVSPEVIAHDLHPDYLSTRYAMERPEPIRIGVQHHHAHVASVMAEHGVDGPVLGIAFDGTGLGTDGDAWGGEILLAEYASFERIATLRPIALAGGDKAIRDVWRTALALLLDTYGDDAPVDRFPLFHAVPPAELAIVRQMIERRINTATAHGAGRYFDAFGALFLGRATSRYEGQVALEWNLAASEQPVAPYPFDIETLKTPWEIDLRLAVRSAIDDCFGSISASTISDKFHATLAAATAATIDLAAKRCGKLPVVFSGGCFQNALLVERLLDRLGSRYRVLGNRDVPPGDGGIAFGQAVVADAVVRKQTNGGA